MRKPLRLLIADDYEVVRRGIRSLLGDRLDWEIVGEAASGREAVEQATRLRPDIAIVDISMPELNGIEATRQIRKSIPQTEVLILTRHDSEELARGMLSAGARGYVLKSDMGCDLIAAIEAVAQRKPFFTAAVSEMVLEGYLTAAEAETPRPVLTPREREIIQLLAEGKGNKEVAVILGVSVHTIETHRAAIIAKLHFHSLSDLVRYAIRNNIIAP